ncbi:hypothetical protein, partial [Rhodoblastus acidophilus]
MASFDETPSRVVSKEGTPTTHEASEPSANIIKRDNNAHDSRLTAPAAESRSFSSQTAPENPFEKDMHNAKKQSQNDHIVDNGQHTTTSPPALPENNTGNTQHNRDADPHEQSSMRLVTAGEAIVSAFASAFHRRPRAEPSGAGGENPGSDQSAATQTTSRPASSPQTGGTSASVQGETPQPNPVPPLSAVSQPAQAPAAEGASGKPMRGSLGLRNLLTDFRPERSESISVAQTAPQDPASAPQA